MKKINKYEIFDVIKKSSIFLLALLFFIMTLTSLGFFVKISISKLHLPIIYLITIIAFLIFYKNDNIKKRIISIILATLVFIVGIVLIGQLYDLTSDGNTYHKLIVGQLKNGWNPVYQDSKDFGKEEGNAFDVLEDNYNQRWADHYAKGTEMIAANIYAVTGNIETGKAYTVILMYIVFGLVISYLINEKKKNVILSIIIGLLLVVNPITLVQFNNFYVDAAVMLSIAIIIYGLITITDKNNNINKFEKYLTLMSGIALCINAKFTGVAFAAMFCFAFYVYWLVMAHKEGKEEFISKLKEYSIFYVIAVVISIGIIGYTSYIENFVRFGHPLYPLYGDPTVQNIPEKEQPKSLADNNNIEKFLISILCKGENVLPSYPVDQNQPQPKIPFSVSTDEIKNYTIPDIRIGGFGPWFSGIMILVGIVTIYLLIKLARAKRWDVFVPYLLILGVMLILLIAVDGTYWARYVAYFYLVPIMALTGLFFERKNKMQIIAGLIISLIMTINVGMIAYANFNNIALNNKYVSQKMQEFKEYADTQETVQIKLNSEGFQGVCYNIDDINVKNYEVNQDIETTRDGLFFSY